MAWSIAFDGELEADMNKTGAPDESIVSLINRSYNMVVNAIIRPERQFYDMDNDLGPKIFEFNNMIYQKNSISFQNAMGETFHCTWYRHLDRTMSPCVIFTHCNTRSCIAGLEYITTILSMGCSFFIFDFTGCGMGSGRYVTYGLKEKEELKIVCDFLRTESQVSKLVLMGHAMGATTNILYTEKYGYISGLILDSTYISMKKLVKDSFTTIRKEGFDMIPKMVFQSGIALVRQTIKSKANFDPYDIKIDKAISKISHIPILFCCGKSDTYVVPSNTDELIEKHSSGNGSGSGSGSFSKTWKNMIQDKGKVKHCSRKYSFFGDHYAKRPIDFHHEIRQFLKEFIIDDDDMNNNTLFISNENYVLSESNKLPWDKDCIYNTNIDITKGDTLNLKKNMNVDSRIDNDNNNNNKKNNNNNVNEGEGVVMFGTFNLGTLNENCFDQEYDPNNNNNNINNKKKTFYDNKSNASSSNDMYYTAKSPKFGSDGQLLDLSTTNMNDTSVAVDFSKIVLSDDFSDCESLSTDNSEVTLDDDDDDDNGDGDGEEKKNSLK